MHQDFLLSLEKRLEQQEEALRRQSSLLLEQKRKIRNLLGILSLGLLLAASSWGGYILSHNNARADGIPTTNPLYYAGTIQENGQPVNGNADLTISLFNVPTGSTALCSTTLTTTVRDGNFRIPLDTTCVNIIRQNANLYAETSYKNQIIAGRNKLAAVPYAVVADTLFSKTLTDQLKIIASVISNNATSQEITLSGSIRDNKGLLVPPGSVVGFVGLSAQVPAGWLLCDGREVSRTTYKALFDVIGITHGSGNGTTTFHLPDYRGRFLRGVDNQAGRDPNAALRTASHPGGATGDRPGTLQDWTTARPRSPFVTNTTGNHSHFTSFQNDDFDGCCTGTRGLEDDGSGARNQNLPTNTTGDHNHVIASGGDTETRPLNVSVNFIVKY